MSKIIPADQYIPEEPKEWRLQGKPHCHHCGYRSAKILVGPEGARPPRFMLCDSCFKQEMTERGSILNRYKPEMFDPDKPYRFDQKSQWDAECGRQTCKETTAEKRKYGVGGKGRIQRASPAVAPSDHECHYCKKVTRRFGLTAEGQTVPMCVTCGLEHDTTPKTETVFSAEPARYSTQWWNVQTEALVRDKGKCYKCGYPSSFVDYIVLPEDGGVWSVRNAACICYRCNKERGRVVEKSLTTTEGKASEPIRKTKRSAA